MAREEEFGRYLNGGHFDREEARGYPLEVCVGWLQQCKVEANRLIRHFRENREDLSGTLQEIRKGISELARNLDRLCDEEESYPGQPMSFLGAVFDKIPEATLIAYREFVEACYKINDTLDEYINYANAFQAAQEKHEILDTRSMMRQPSEVRAALVDQLGLLLDSLGGLARSLGQAAPSVVNPGQDGSTAERRRPAQAR